MQTKKINIVTPTSRPENLEKIAPSIKSIPGIEIVWWVVLDNKLPITTGIVDSTMDTITQNGVKLNIVRSPHTALAGHAHRNDVLDQITDDKEWFYSVDDDNILHYKFLEQIAKTNKKGIIVAQRHKDGSLRLPVHADRIKLNHIDTAQFAFEVSLLDGYHRFFEDRYDADGVFIEELYKNNKSEFELINEPLCYYNYLR